MNPRRAWAVGVLVALSMPAYAQVTYDFGSGLLSISSVNLLGSTYTGVTLQNVGNFTFQLRDAQLQPSPSQAVAAYEGGSGLLLLPTVSAGGTNYAVTLQNIGNYTFTIASANYAAPQSFPVLLPFINFVSAPSASNVSVSGNYNGADISGSTGTITRSGMTPAVFEGPSALAQSSTAKLNLVTGGSISQTQIEYFDSNFQPLGVAVQGGNYQMVTGTDALPLTAPIGANGRFYTETIYSGSDKSSVIATATLSYALQPDPPSTSTALLVLTAKATSPQGSLLSTGINTFRVTPSGNVTWLSASQVQGSDSLVLTAN
jgi:hypothetical protein